jgi:putative glutamine amidotransferase
MADPLPPHERVAASHSSPHRQRPVVVIAGARDSEPGRCVVSDGYAEAVLRAGGLPLIRPSGIDSPALVDDLLRHADAVLIPGGRDLDTARLGLGPVHPRATLVPPGQQDADVALASAALGRTTPVLGICYGMQVLGLVSGGRLHQHLADDAPGTVAHRADDGGVVRHDVQILAGSRTSAALGLPGGGPLRVHSSHHQALASVGPDWQVTAQDADGLIEGIEHTGPGLAIGVQWHPDRADPGGAEEGLFAVLVAAATAGS